MAAENTQQAKTVLDMLSKLQTLAEENEGALALCGPSVFLFGKDGKVIAKHFLMTGTFNVCGGVDFGDAVIYRAFDDRLMLAGGFGQDIWMMPVDERSKTILTELAEKNLEVVRAFKEKTPYNRGYKKCFGAHIHQEEALRQGFSFPPYIQTEEIGGVFSIPPDNIM